MKNPMYSNAGGYGFWCNEECAARKDAEKAVELQQSGVDVMMGEAAIAQSLKGETPDAWTPLAITGVVVGSMLAIAVMVVIIKRAKAKK